MTSAHLQPETSHADTPWVYVGPSISPSAVAELLPGARIRAPVVRGDLYRDRELGGAIFIIIDGVFSHELAVSPREVIDIARDGALVLGASSMGALRAAECWPVGVRGIGLVYRAFRMGVLSSDGEVAVGTDQDNDYRAVSVALVNVRYAVSHAIRRQILDRPSGRRLVDAASRMFYPERQWRAVLREARVADGSGELLRFLSAQDIKRRDAVQALQHAGDLLRLENVAAKHGRAHSEPFVRPNRTTSEPFFGSSAEGLRDELVEWLFGTGRYRRYIWTLLAGHADFQGMPQTNRAERLREVLCDVLARALPHDATFANMVWEELEFLGELHAEIARMYAAKRLARDAERMSLRLEPRILQRVREEVSIAHGAYQWSLLLENVVEGRFCGAIPFAWIDRSCHAIASARAFVEHMSSASSAKGTASKGANESAPSRQPRPRERHERHILDDSESSGLPPG